MIDVKNKNRTHKEIITEKRQKYKLYRLKGMCQEDAALAAGYSKITARTKAYRIDKSAKVGMDKYLERAGLTNKALAEHAAKGLEATKLVGMNDEEHPDWMARHRYFTSALELKGLVIDPRTNNPQEEALHIRVLNIVNNYNFNENVELKDKVTIDVENVAEEITTRSGVDIA